MSNVIDFTGKRKEKQIRYAEEIDENILSDYRERHEEVLELCSDVFESGVILITSEDGELQFSTSIDDHETVLEVLLAASDFAERRSDEKDN